MSNAKFFNCVDFPVNFRLIWLPNNPAIQLQPGQIIEGPYELLITYNFLRPLQQQTIKSVSLSTQDEQGNYLDETINTDMKEKEQWAETHRVSFLKENGEQNDETDIPIDIKIDTSELPFDPKDCNWIKVTLADLEKAANILKVDMSSLTGVAPKKRKWELVRLIKEISKGL